MVGDIFHDSLNLSLNDLFLYCLQVSRYLFVLCEETSIVEKI